MVSDTPKTQWQSYRFSELENCTQRGQEFNSPPWSCVSSFIILLWITGEWKLRAMENSTIFEAWRWVERSLAWGWGLLDPLSSPVIWSWESHRTLWTSSAYLQIERIAWEERLVPLVTTLRDIHKKNLVPCENMEGTISTVVPGLLVCWENSGRALPGTSHTGRTAKSLQRMSSEWHGQSQRGTRAFYLNLTPLNPVEDDSDHTQQRYWLWAHQGSETLHKPGPGREWDGFYFLQSVWGLCVDQGMARDVRMLRSTSGAQRRWFHFTWWCKEKDTELEIGRLELQSWTGKSPGKVR